MGYEQLVGDIELKYLVVNLKLGSRIVSFLQRIFESFYILTLTQHLTLRPSPFFVGSVLLSTFCTQGLLTLVAGESHAQACFGPCCMSVYEVDDDEE